MGEVVGPSASIETIESHARTAFTRGVARGGKVAEVAPARLGPALERVDGSKSTRSGAQGTVASALGDLLARDDGSDKVIGEVRDGIWNFLNRAQNHPIMDHVLPGGMKSYTGGDPRKQHVLMSILQSRIDSASGLPESERKGWIAKIEVVREPHEAAADVLVTAEATEQIAEAAYRAHGRSLLTALRGLKRDLKDLNMTEAQIREIIPDAGEGARKPSATPETPK